MSKNPQQLLIMPMPGIIISRIQQKTDRICFTIQVAGYGKFFIQAFGKSRLLCDGLKQGDALTAITVPRSFRPERSHKDHVYFELVGVFSDPKTTRLDLAR